MKLNSYDGTEIFYHVTLPSLDGRGEGERLPLVFCYGIVCNNHLWKHQVKYFKKNYPIIQFDYRGHNASKSPKKSENLTIEACAKDLDAILNKLGISKAVLLGHSMGVNVILQYYDLYPQKVDRLVAICGTVKNPFKTMFNTEFSQAGFELLKLMYLKFPKQIEKFWGKSIANPVSQLLVSLAGFNFQFTHQKDIKNYLDRVSQQPPDTFFHFLQEMINYRGEKIIKKIRVPALIIGGEKDLITPIKNQYELYRKIPNAQFLKVPKGSHCAHMDMPDLVNLRIEKFLTTQFHPHLIK